MCCYSGDSNVSNVIFAGDKIGAAKVVWSSNSDTTTGCVSVTGLDTSCTAYYFGFFAIDKVCQYNQGGIYSYAQSNPSASEIKCTAGYQCIQTNGVDPTATLPITLPALNNFPIKLNVDDKVIDLVLRGSALSTYQTLVDELNESWKHTAINQFEQNTAPYYGQFSYVGGLWSQWNGTQYNIVKPVISNADPTAPPTNSAWFDLTTSQLKLWSGTAWVLPSPLSPVISYASDPSLPKCDDYWYDGTTAHQFDGVVWKDVATTVTALDPNKAPMLDCTNFWKSGDVFFRWNDTSDTWTTPTVLVMNTTPQTITTGSLWYNPMTMVLSVWNGSIWVATPATLSTTAPASPTNHQYWIDPLTKHLMQYNSSSTWVSVTAIVYHKQPTDLAVADVLFNTTLNTLSEWDGTTWIDITSKLFIQTTNPATKSPITQGSLWYNTTLGLWFKLVGTVENCSWVGVNVLQSIVSPSALTAGYWFNTITRLWYERVGSTWSQIYPTSSVTDPTQPVLGTTWYDGSQLFQRDSTTTWVVVPFSTSLLVIPVGTRWLNSASGALNIWTGSTWDQITAPFIAAWNEINNINIVSQLCGEPSMIEVISSPLLFIDLTFTAGTPILGLDGYSGRPMTEEIGVGTDGSVDERRKIINNLFTRLGAPTVNVELSREQMDLAVQKGLDYIRRDSGAGNSRAYFFLDLKRGQQNYLLTSRSVGFNTIVDVLNLYRTRGGLLTNNSGGSDLYGQQLVQQLYSSGTFDLLSFHLMSSYQSLVNKLFVREFQFQWTERKRLLSIMRNIGNNERILVDAVIERTEQDLLTDRMTKNWIEDWALSEAMIMLGNMRGKFSSLAGAGGSITLNAESLKAEAVTMQTLLISELDDYVASDVETWGIGASITKG
jgi:hypothetical protein